MNRLTLTIATLVIAALHAVAQPQFNREHGIYAEDLIRVTITPGTPGAEVRYTLDCSTPTAASTLYTTPVVVSGTTVLRAVDVKDGRPCSDVTTATYVFPASVLNQSNTPPGYPDKWGHYAQISGTATADYEMDPEMTRDPKLRDKIVEGIGSLPILSIVSDRDNFFSHERNDSTGGIYIYTGTPVGDPIGRGWERPVSIELMQGPQQHDLTTTCGIVIHGGHGRLPEKNPKHSFRLKFKKAYGPGKLEYPVFGPDGPDEMDQLVLRCHFGNTWQHWNGSYRPRAQYTRDLLARSTQQRMGHPAVAGLYVNLFLNGMYWGIYNIAERIDNQYCKNHFGGKKSEYDVIKVEETNGNAIEASEGTLDVWNQMVEVAEQAGSNDNAYLRLAGLDKDGQPDTEQAPLLDIDGFIDYMLINQYAGNNDWDSHNWYAVSRHEGPTQGVQFLCWDTEQIFESLDDNRLGLDNRGRPTHIFQQLMQNRLFMRRYIDHANAALSQGGWLSAQGVVAVWDSLYSVIATAVYAEAARWGDYRRDVHPYTSRGKLFTVDDTYMTERRHLLNDYFPQRTARLLSQLRSRHWFPQTVAPRFVCNGKSSNMPDTLTTDDVLTLTANAGDIIYTPDGTDPVSWLHSQNGTTTPTAQTYQSGQNLLTRLASQGDTRICLRAICRNGGEWSPTTTLTFSLVTTLGIANIAAGQASHPRQGIYDLTGRRIANSPDISTLPPGIYIVDGRKVMKK